MSNLLSVENLTMRFGGLTAIDDLSFDAKNNQITSIIGPNGAGKTTVFNCLTGFYKPTNGEMFLNQSEKRIPLKKFTDFKISTWLAGPPSIRFTISSSTSGSIFSACDISESLQ